jgi:DNA polymerase-3 subunit epsilon
MLRLFNRGKKTARDGSTLINDGRYVVIDTELTGLDEKKDSIVSIGAVRMTGGRIDLGDTFYRLVSPRTEMIHEITPSEVLEKPRIDAVLDEFLAYCGSDILMGHFISIDLAFLDREVRRARRHKLQNAVLDTCSIYAWLRKRNPSRSCFAAPLNGYRLSDIAPCFRIPVDTSHHALMDAYTTAQLFQRFIPLLGEDGVNDIGGLLEIGVPFEGGDRFRSPGEISNF